MRDQLLAALRSKTIDRHFFLPLCVWDYYPDIPEYAEAMKNDPKEGWMRGYGGETGMKARIAFCEMIGALLLGWCEGQAFTEERDSSVKVSHREVDGRVVRTYETPIGSLQEVSQASSVAWANYIVEHPIKTAEDARIYKYIIEATTPIATYENAQKQLDIIGQAGIMDGAGFGVPFHCLIGQMGEAPALMLSFDMPTEFRELMDAMHKKNLQVVKILSDSPLIMMDHESIWSMGLISPAIFEEHYVPYQQEYNEILHAGGKITFDHISGQYLWPFVEGIEKCGHDFITGITVESDNCDRIADLLDRWDGKMTAVMGPSPDFLRRHTAEEVTLLVEKFVDALGDRKVVFGTADAVVPGTAPENLKAIARVLGLI
jgi:hypothetical protein